MLNVGLIGFGFSGKVFHAPVIRAVDGLRLTTIVQRHGTPDPRYSDVEVVRSVEELLTGTIDLVVIATPNTSHHPIAQQCNASSRDATSSSTSRLPPRSVKPKSSSNSAP